MSSTAVLQVTGVKESAASKLQTLKTMGFVNTADTVRCLHCSARYLLLVNQGARDGAPVHVLDLGKAIRELTEKVSAEHAGGHTSDRITVDRDLAVEATLDRGGTIA